MIGYRTIRHSFVPNLEMSPSPTIDLEHVHVTIRSAEVDVQGIEIFSKV